jgi:hypothetical protein
MKGFRMDNYLLIKFGAFEHMKLLIETGQVYMDVLSSYRKTEHNKQRHDPNDGIKRIIQATGAKFSVTNKETGTSELIGYFNDGLGRETTDKLDKLNVFCMYHFPLNVTKEVKFSDIIDDRVSTGFGDTAVFIKDSQSFLSRIKDVAIMHGYKFIPSLVEYVDIKNRHGEVGAFMKDLEFDHQQELRIGVSTSNSDGSPIKLTIGDISDIATLVSSKELLEFTIRPKNLT